MPLNEWTTIVVTVDRTVNSGAGVDLYLNGANISMSGGVGVFNPFTNSSVEVGGGGFQGEIDEVTLYNYILSEEEIRADFNDLTYYANFEQNGCGNYYNHINLEPIDCYGSPQSTPNTGIAGQGTGEGTLRHSIPSAYPFTGEDNSFSISMWYKEVNRAPAVLTATHSLLQMGRSRGEILDNMFRVDLYGDPIDETNMSGTLDLHVAFNACLDDEYYDNEEVLVVDNFLPWNSEGWNQHRVYV